VKQAPGGIRDVETIVQFLSLLHCGKQPALVTPSTLLSLERLRVAGAISTLEASRLRAAYRFHRRVENLLQVMHRVQTHSLPADTCRSRDSWPARRGGLRRGAGRAPPARARRLRTAFRGAFGNLEGAAAAVSELVLAGLPTRGGAAHAGRGRQRAAGGQPRRAAPRGRPVSRFLPPRRACSRLRVGGAQAAGAARAGAGSGRPRSTASSA